MALARALVLERLTAMLRREGWTVNGPRVRRLMTALGIHGRGRPAPGVGVRTGRSSTILNRTITDNSAQNGPRGPITALLTFPCCYGIINSTQAVGLVG